MRQPHHHLGLVAEARSVLGRHEVGQHRLDDAELLQPAAARRPPDRAPHPPARERLQQHIGVETARERHHQSLTGGIAIPRVAVSLGTDAYRHDVLGRRHSEQILDKRPWAEPSHRRQTRHRSRGQTVVLGITGGIAAYKAAELCRLLVKAGATVRVVMTEAATRSSRL